MAHLCFNILSTLLIDVTFIDVTTYIAHLTDVIYLISWPFAKLANECIICRSRPRDAVVMNNFQSIYLENPLYFEIMAITRHLTFDIESQCFLLE